MSTVWRSYGSCCVISTLGVMLLPLLLGVLTLTVCPAVVAPAVAALLTGEGPSEEHETASMTCGEDLGVFKGTCWN